MTALDTNVVVRFLTRDDEAQFQKARALFTRHPIFIPDTVWLETEWVLRFAYGYEPAAVTKAFRDLLALPEVQVSDAGRLSSAIEWHVVGLDFADALHLASSQESEVLTTFDKAFVAPDKGTVRAMLTGAQPLEEGELRRRQAALLPFRENIERISDDILLNGSLPAVARAADGGRRLTLLRNYRDTYLEQDIRGWNG